MSKTILTLDEVNLLLNSEEPKNKELYGNLYDILSQLNPRKALSEEYFKLLDSDAVSALTYNKQSLIDTVIQEWYAEHIIEEDDSQTIRCGLCNTPNKYLYFIRNRKNNNILNVGSSCITKFPGIEGYVEQKQQLSHIIKNQKAVVRRNEFHRRFPNVDDIIFECKKYQDFIPIAIPYDLYEDLNETIIRLRKIYNVYVDSGKKPFKSLSDSFELFQINLNHYNKIKSQIDKYVEDNILLPHICKRREAEWLKQNGKNSILNLIQKNNGFYTITTLGMIYSFDFIYDNFSSILQHQKTQYITIHKLKQQSTYIYISFKKKGYDYPITGKITFQNFMKSIGSNSLFNANYTYSDKDILSITHIDSTMNNINSILNYIFEFIENMRCVILVDYNKNTLILYRKRDKAIRNLKIQNFINLYVSHILKSDKGIYSFLENTIKRSSTKWMTIDEQSKYGIDEDVGRMYKEQYLSRFSED